ncbi:DUF1616 domain-containing protein [Halorubrum sp. DTA46]|uniref:DUF1616 domain-containing protein n=1 Tax=Halorubrum sp. DTA46 TaxID=3402162 RepID=UPI003AAACDED
MFGDSTARYRGQGLSLDLLLALVMTAVVWGFILFGAESNPLQLLIGVLYVVFLPGYAFVAVLFPSRSSESTNSLSRIALNRERPKAITITERVVLSVGMSVVLVPFVGVVAHFSGWGVAAETIVALVGVLTAVLSLAGIAARLRLPRDQRFGLVSADPLRRVHAWVFDRNDTREVALSAFVVAGLLIAVVGIGAAAALTPNGEQYTEFYLLGEDEGADDSIADNYPSEIVGGEFGPMQLGVTNQEGGERTYTVVEQVQRTDGTGAGTAVVASRDTDQFEVTAAHGETVERAVSVEPTLRGGNVRVVYLLYVGEPPEDPDVDSAYRTTHVWIETGE